METSIEELHLTINHKPVRTIEAMIDAIPNDVVYLNCADDDGPWERESFIDGVCADLGQPAGAYTTYTEAEWEQFEEQCINDQDLDAQED